MTNQIEDAIITLIKAHAVTPEIDYTELADRLHDKVCDNVDYDAIKDQVVASLDIDAGDVASVLDASEIASEIALDEVANEICFSSLAQHIDLSDLAGHLDEDQLQDNIKDAVMVDMAEKFAAMEKRIADLEAKLSEMSERLAAMEETACTLTDTVCDLKARIAELESWRMVHMTLAQQPQPQPSTPIEMIERAKNLLADSLGMLNNPA